MRSWNNKYIDQYQYAVDIYEQESGFANAGMYDLLQIWLASLAPNPLTNEAMPLAAALADPIFELATGRMRPLSGLEGLHQVAGVLMLRRLVARGDASRAGRRLRLRPCPSCLTARTSWIGIVGTSVEPAIAPEPISATAGYLLQAECALDLVASFLQELRRLDRYQDATIVIHGDTGDWMPLGQTTRETRQDPGLFTGEPALLRPGPL